MTGFEPRTSDVGSDHFTNWAATTTAQPTFFANRNEIKRYIWPYLLPSKGLVVSALAFYFDVGS